MTDAPIPIPLADIDAAALPRDRTALDPEALAELRASILAAGLRQPIEVFEAEPAPGDAPGCAPYGLISGLRRLTVFRELSGNGSGDPRFATIPAFVRAPRDAAEAMADMIAENEIRAALTPWERGRIAVEARDAGFFPTLDAAVAGLYPALDRFRRARIRGVATVVEALGDDLLADPRALSQNQLGRLEAAIRQGFGPLIEGALTQSRETTPDGQWRVLAPIVEEAEEDLRAARTDPDGRLDPRAGYRPGRPRRMIRPRLGLYIRRERTAEGWNLRFTGPDATGPLMDEIMDYVEQTFGRED